MRLLPLLTAAVVTAFLYALVFERDALLAFAQADTSGAVQEAAAEAEEVNVVRVMAMNSTAQTVDSAVILRGRTEAARQVEVRAETTGQVISDPLRAGATVSAGDMLCELDPGTRMAQLQEAQGRLQEARARLPEAQARIPEAEARKAEAQSRVSEAQSRVAEANARLAAARIEQNAANRLSEGGFASETRVANAEAGVESALAGVTSAQAALEGAQAGIAAADAGLEGAAASVESAKAGIESAQAAVASAERELDRLTITAPFGGLLETDTAELGSLLQPGSPCATIIQLDPIKLVGFVPETEVGKISVGAMAGARLTSGEEIVGEVTFLSRSADETTRTFRVEITVPNDDLSIGDGQTAEILVASAGEIAHLLPQSALTLNDDGALGVRTIAEGDSALFMEVEILRDTVDGVWVTGLPEEVAIITVGQEFVTDGVRVAPSFEETEG